MKNMKDRKEKGRQRTKRTSPYAHINWEKATILFHQAETKIPARRVRAGDILRLLATVVDRGMLFIAKPDDPAVAEYVFHGTGPLTWRTKSVIERFRQQRYVTIAEREDGNIVVKITKNGMTKALSYQLDSLKVKVPKRWDGKWRVVIFDVPERYRRVRDVFRMRLRQLGLLPLQESVFVSPYPCFEEIEFLRELYGIAFTVRYLLVEKIEDDASLRSHFDL